MNNGRGGQTVAVQNKPKVVEERAVDHQGIPCDKDGWRLADDKVSLTQHNEP